MRKRVSQPSQAEEEVVLLPLERAIELSDYNGAQYRHPVSGILYTVNLEEDGRYWVTTQRGWGIFGD